MSNEPIAFNVANKTQADMLAQLLESSAVKGPDARALAYLYDEAQRVKAAFADGT